MKYLVYLSLLVIGCSEEKSVKQTADSAYNYTVMLGYKPVAAVCSSRRHVAWDKCAVNVGIQQPIILECNIYSDSCVIASTNK